MDSFGRIAGVCGVALLSAGLVCLYFAGQMAFQFFSDPAQVPLLQYISSHFKLSGQEVTGTMDGKEFTIQIPDPLLHISYLGLAIIACGLLISLVTTLISNGTSLMKMGFRKEKSSAPAVHERPRERKPDNF